MITSCTYNASINTDNKPSADSNSSLKLDINNGDTYTTSSTVTLNITAVGFAEMYITNTAGCEADGNWQPIVSTLSWTLATGDGVKSVYIKYRDSSGQETACETDSIELYSTAPTATLTSLPGAITSENNLLVSVEGTFVTAYKYKFGSAVDCTDAQGYSAEIASSAKITENLLLLPEGNYTLCVVAKNPAGTYQSFSSATTYTFYSGSPFLFIEAPGQAITTNSAVQLTLLARAHYTEMYVTNTAGCASGGAWEVYNSNKSGWTLDAGQLGSTATVYAKFRTSALVESSCVSDTISSVVVAAINACSATTSSTTIGNYYDSGGPGVPYGNNLNCNLTITAGVPIKLRFTEFAMESGFDFLSVWDSTVSAGTSLGVYSGYTLPPDLIAPSGTLILNFLSDGGVTDTGISASWAPVTGVSNLKFSINNGDTYVATSSVTLNVTGLSLAEMYVTNTAGCASGGSWEAFATSRSWSLSSGDGEKSVYIKYRDSAGHETPCENDTIELYTAPPVAVLTNLPAAVSYDSSLSVLVGGSFVSAYKYKLGASADCSDATGYSVEKSFTIPITDSMMSLPDGNYTLCVVAKNPSGMYQPFNSSTSYTFNFDSPREVSVAQIFKRSNEGNASESLSITLSQAKSYDINVTYDLSATSATSGTHFSGITAGVVTIPSGQTSAVINYSLTENAAADGEKFLQINLTSANKLAISIGSSMQFRHYIVDNDSALDTALKISAGVNHTCGVTGLGVLKCWGLNGNGQIGDGSTTMRKFPVIVNSGVAYSMVAAGVGNHSCGITSTGELKCWGTNANGQLGDISTTQRLAPVVVNSGTNYNSVTAGDSHSCGITSLNNLKCWGKNTNNQLGDGTATQRTSPIDVDSGTSYQKVEAGLAYTCGITSVGVLKCWGLNTNGKLGDGSTTQRALPTVIDPGVNYADINTGDNHTCGITTAGVLKCWGLNSSGQLGRGDLVNQSSPVVIDSGVTYSSVSAGTAHTCAITTVGQLKCWGANSKGQLGNGSVTNALLPNVIDIGAAYTQISVGGNHTCGITSGYSKCWGARGSATILYGQLGEGSESYEYGPTLVQPEETYSTIDTVGGTTCGITTSGIVKCWGLNGNGHVGDGTVTTRTAAMQIDPGVTYSDISVGYSSTCGITTAGVLKCWGANGSGQLGDGTTTRRLRPTVIDSGTSYSKVAQAWLSSCAITTTGVLKCWGYNSTGQLGDGTTTNRISPVVIDSGVSYSFISSQESHACGITTTGVLKCWGENINGMIGDGTTTQRNSPVIIDSGTTYSFVSTGFATTCGITTAGVLKCWGKNDRGQVGDNSTVQKTTPVIIDSGVSYIYVDNSINQTTCGVTSTGVLKAWGRNNGGQIGDGTLTQRHAPVLSLDATPYVLCRSGNVYGNAITSTGQLKGWGMTQSNFLGANNVWFRPGIRPVGFEVP